MDQPAQPRFHDTILDCINEGVFTVNKEKRILSFNAAAEKITKVPKSKAVGRKCCRVIRADVCRNTCAMDQTLNTGESVVHASARIKTAMGCCVPVRISTAPLKDGQGNVIGGVETFQDLTQVERLRRELEDSNTFEGIIGRSHSMRELFKILPLVAESDSTVLIRGATGTGKELFARTIHNLSNRRKKRFVAVNCAALPDTLLESELFGYKAGAFTGAVHDKPGRFALAEGGTIFLDEIGDLLPSLQVRLLRVLQERCVEPLGGVDPVQVDVRVIAATNKDLTELVEQEAFRDDLFYRIRVVDMMLPPLRERREDIPLLVDHLVARFNLLRSKAVDGVSDAVLSKLMEHSYPGNVRELENIIEQAFVLCRSGRIELEHLPRELAGTSSSGLVELHGPFTLKTMERLLIVESLERHGGNRTRAAKSLGINPSTLFRKMKAYGIVPLKGNGKTGRLWRPKAH